MSQAGRAQVQVSQKRYGLRSKRAPLSTIGNQDVVSNKAVKQSVRCSLPWRFVSFFFSCSLSHLACLQNRVRSGPAKQRSAMHASTVRAIACPPTHTHTHARAGHSIVSARLSVASLTLSTLLGAQAASFAQYDGDDTSMSVELSATDAAATVRPAGVPDIDVEHAEDPQMVPQYAKEIHRLVVLRRRF